MTKEEEENNDWILKNNKNASLLPHPTKTEATRTPQHYKTRSKGVNTERQRNAGGGENTKDEITARER